MKKRGSIKIGSIQMGLLLATIVITGSQCPSKTGYNPANPVLGAIFRQPGQYVPHNLGGEYEALPANFIIIRLTEGGLPKRKITVDGDSLESITNDQATITKLDLQDKGYWWNENIGNDYVDIKVFPPKSKRNGPRFNIGVTNISTNPPAGNSGYSNPLNLFFVTPSSKRITEPSDVFFDCGQDYDAIDGKYYYNCKESSSIIKRNIVVAGWLIDEPTPNSGVFGTEDYFFNIMPDVDFMGKLYGPTGIYNVLSNTVLPGDPPGTFLNFNMNDIDENTGTSRGIDINSFSLPLSNGNNIQGSTNIMYIHGELNCWHENNSGGLFTKHFVGRGPHPAGWIEVNFGYTDSWWPYDPRYPSNGANDGSGLHKGDYVVMKGTLWQDGGHGTSEWLLNCSASFTGWIELHPIDWIEKPGNRPAGKCIGIATNYIGYQCIFSGNSLTMDPPGPTPDDELIKVTTIVPDQSIMPKPTPGAVLQFSEIIDGRFTDMGTVTKHEVKVVNDELQVTTGVKRRVDNQKFIPGKFKAGYLLWWQ